MSEPAESQPADSDPNKNFNELFFKSDDWYLAANVVVVGEVSIGTDTNLWYGTVVRGDDASITIGARVNLQDQTIVHADPGVPLTIGDDVTVGHRAILHCRSIESGCLIGMGAVLMEDVVVGAGSLVAAGSVVPPGTVIPPNSLVRGVPGRVVRETTAEEREGFLSSAKKYVENAREFYRLYGD